MATELAKAYVQIVPSAQGIQGALSSALDGEATAAGNSAGSKLGAALLSGAKVGVAAFGTAATGMAAFGASSVEAGKAFDSAMSQVAATMGMSMSDIQNNINGAGDTFDQLREKARELGGSTVYSAEEAAQGLNILAMSGYDSAQSMEMLEDVLHLAAAGSMDMASAAGFVSGAMKGFNDDTKDARYYADLMAQGATLANTNVQQLGEAMSSGAAGAAAYGQSADSMTIALLRLAEQGENGAAAGTALAAAMKNLYTPTDQAKQALDELGIEAFDAVTGEARDFNDIVNELDEALSGFTDEQQAAYKQTIFGIQGLDAYNKMTVTGIEKQNEWAESLGRASDGAGAAAKQYNTMTDNLEGALASWDSAISDMKIEISDQLTPTLREFVDFGTEGIQELTAAFREGGLSGAMEAFGGFLSEGLAMLLEALPDVVNAGAELLTALVQGIADNAELISNAAVEICTTITTTLLELLPTLLDAGLNILANIVIGIANAIPQLIDTIVGVVTRIVQVIIDNLPLLLDAALQIITALATGIFQALPTLLEQLPGLVRSLVETLLTQLPVIIEAGVELLTALIEDLPTIINTIVEVLPEIVDAIVSTLMDNLPALIEAGVTLFVALVENMPEITKQIVACIPVLIDNMLQEFANLIVKFEDMGWDIMMGLAQGIADSVGAVIKSAVNSLDGVVDSIKDYFGISSPSKMFEEFGGYLDMGLAIGIEDDADLPIDAMEDMSAELSRAYELDAEIQRTYSFEPVAEGGDIIIPVNIGEEEIDTIVVNAQDRNQYRSGGR